MQIGSSFNFTNTTVRPGVQIPANRHLTHQQAESHTSNPQPETVVDVTELIQVAEQGSKERARFYTMDRDIPLKGQEALSTYLTNSQFTLQSESTQLVGVDIYI
ncbi:hypothetical protein [Motiliproteus sp. MSK22-1]|uniref:hypothetical protein n=1 Tax=Motiliproteus sp. MSK22-1 TaxID=1897630 RepID=UPI00097645B2|nr:hypothetical protein [Motiliproteus sp. MSK22-1]OMH30230.1 hypothetical protein BGP75_17710 [Motiliproteus sp. MSK22-1]